MVPRPPPAGAREAELAARFFMALEARDSAALVDLLDEHAVLENIDGPVTAPGRHALAAHLAGGSPESEYRLEQIDAAPGRARVYFTLLIAEVPGGIRLSAEFSFTAGHIHRIVVGQPD